MATTQLKKLPIPPPRRVFHREKVAKQFGGHTVMPSDVSTFLAVDRAAACRILQMLVKRGEAKTTAHRGEYYVYKQK